MDQIRTTVSNTSFVPSAMDLLLAGPRLAQRAGAFALFTVPERIDNFFGKLRSEGMFIPEATMADLLNASGTITSPETIGKPSSLPKASANATMAGEPTTASNPFTFESIRNLGGMFTYMTSKWALVVFIIALILNRTQFYASSRNPLRLRWPSRLLLYIIPLGTFLSQSQFVLQAMKCQTSPNFALLRYHDADKSVSGDLAGMGGFLYYLSSTLLFWKDDAACCSAMKMIPTDGDPSGPLYGSLSLLWPLLLSFCIGQFCDTLACALQGRQQMPEVGMTIFEHSLAFAETESLVSSSASLGLIGPSDSSDARSVSPSILKRSALIQSCNAPPEVLLISLISCCSHLSSNILAVLGLRAKLRLLNTGFWAICYMTTFSWSLCKVFFMSSNSFDQLGLPGLPTACIVGFIPHLLVLIGISICAIIYMLAFIITLLSPPRRGPAPLTFRERVALAYDNLQANVHLSLGAPIRINWQEDFYTSLLKIGFSILTSASEAVYLNEGQGIRIARMTWLEQKRLGEVLQRRALVRRSVDSIPPELTDDLITGATSGRTTFPGGYARERKTRHKRNTNQMPVTAGIDNGVGLLQRRGRWTLSLDFLKGILWLVGGVFANLLHLSLRQIGIQYRPQWITRLRYGGNQPPNRPQKPSTASDTTPLDFYLLSPDGELTLPPSDRLDVEREMRHRMQDIAVAQSEPFTSEEKLDAQLYSWWLSGGKWGDLDSSGDYVARSREQEDDLTSVISAETDISGLAQWSDDDGGQTTPTRERPFFDSDGPPVEDTLDTVRLAQLLDPKSPEEASEARMLARHLRSDRPLTRSQYQRNIERDRRQILMTSMPDPRGRRSSQSTNADEEEMLLESFVLEQRRHKQAAPQGGPTSAQGQGSWNTGAAGMGSSGPQCVVCQSSPRTILVWPCGCLSLCDECRVGLAMRNFAACVCCRAEVGSYSRLYVP
ncbi:MAG: hypothetical protein M1821_000549 [Bathelium mastoideum]|nr:MAG: hypothetical protein M1821_000549 [Bathelium mastoideum]KAI9683014.1 MAG: hypothetical protein M1822_006207 [Bathelium mastoideum]